MLKDLDGNEIPELFICRATEEFDSGVIYQIFTWHDGKTIVCWEKARPFAEGRYIIRHDGVPVKEVAADPFSTQFATVDAPYRDSFSVEYREER